jgi:methionyl-tRNA formyltransferase
MSKLKVAIFGSFYRGHGALLNLLRDTELLHRIEMTGVVTDDPSQSFTSPGKRVWQYLHTDAERNMMEELATEHGIPVFKGRIKSKEFYEALRNVWKPDIIYMATFGQLLDKTILNIPRLGVYNAHPTDGETWPSCVGPNPFEQILAARKPDCAIALHHVNEKFDDGELVSFSGKVPVPYAKLDAMPAFGDRIIHMHRLASLQTASVINAHLRSVAGLSSRTLLPSPRAAARPAPLSPCSPAA